jgi:hypothetical protein
MKLNAPSTVINDTIMTKRRRRRKRKRGGGWYSTVDFF